MSDEDKKSSIFKKALDASEAWLDMQIQKAKGDLNAKTIEDESDLVFAKTITEDPTYRINSQGYKDKPHRLLDSHLKQMAIKNSIIAAIIQTRQNQIAKHSKLVKSDQEVGFRVKLKNEDKFLEEIKAELAKDVELNQEIEKEESVAKAEGVEFDEQTDTEKEVIKDDKDDKSDDDVEEFNWELERKAKERLEEEIKDRRQKVEEFIENCGLSENRPFESKKWNFDSYLRAIVRDRLTYDRMCTEKVFDQVGDIHHFFPADGSTIKYASPQLKKYKSFPGSQMNTDLLYPEKQVDYLNEKTDALELDDELLEEEQYKYVQVVKGRIERAYTADEMAVGMFNQTTDIYNNGYSISELELMVGLVSSHLNAEYYNQAYFEQGFSAKGILHLKANINRRKLETVRQQWHHMIKGSRNSFQTPIFAGMDDVSWIPLTQNHNDIGFEGWMRYLIKVICAIYQIDPKEIGLGFKDEGGGAGLSGDDTKQKLEQSKDKGLYPMLRFIETYINQHIIAEIDPDFKIEFTGIKAASAAESLARQEKEVKFKKTVNEIRFEDGLPPLPGMDNIILDPVYFQWYSQFSKEAQKMAEQMMEQQQQQMGMSEENNNEPEFDDNEMMSLLSDEPEQTPETDEEEVSKSLKIEYYKLEK